MVLKLIKYSASFILSMGITTLFQIVDKISLNYCRVDAVAGVYLSIIMFGSIFAIVHAQTLFRTLWMSTSFEYYSKYPEDRAFH